MLENSIGTEFCKVCLHRDGVLEVAAVGLDSRRREIHRETQWEARLLEPKIQPAST